jgi:MurNAc alpha-1-phosphate uridylyltransferase
MTAAVMLFAAGLGTRMGHLTADRPKPLIPVAGRALIDHALDLARDAGTARVVVNLHYKAEMIAAHLAGQPDVLFSPEPGQRLETGGGLKAALPLLGPGAVTTLNTDAVWTGANPIRTLRAGWDGTRMDALLMLVPGDRARGHSGPGDFSLDAAGRVARGGTLVYTGAQIISGGSVADWPEDVFSLNAVWDGIAARGRLFGVVHAGGWCDVGHPGAIPLAETLLQDRAADVS